MYTIGQFAAMTQLTRKALRFYDETGLLKPSRVEWDTGYRLYDESNLDTARQIIILKNCGLSLSEIGKLLEKGSGEGDSFPEILKKRRREMELLARDVETSRNRLEQMIAETAETAVEDPELLPLEGLTGLALSVFGSEEEGVSSALSDLYAWGAVAGVPFLSPHRIVRNLERESASEEECDFRVFVPVDKPHSGDPDKGILPLALLPGPGVRIVHRGSFTDLAESWKRLLAFMEQARVVADGPARETYRIPGPSVVIEIPVREAAL